MRETEVNKVLPCVLKEVQDILVERDKSYGDNFPSISNRWGCKEIDVALRMIDMKLSRCENKGIDNDTLIDIAGYALMAIVIHRRGDND